VLSVHNSVRSKQSTSGRSPQLLALLFPERDPGFLIANLELEFHVSPIRITKLRFSNRKYSPLFHPPRPTAISCPEERRVYPQVQRACPQARTVHRTRTLCAPRGFRAGLRHRSNGNSLVTEKESSRRKERGKQNSNSNKSRFPAIPPRKFFLGVALRKARASLYNSCEACAVSGV
jgi:hypothetical protein